MMLWSLGFALFLTTHAQSEIEEDGNSLERYRLRILSEYEGCQEEYEEFCCNHTQINETLWGNSYVDVTRNCSTDHAVYNTSMPCPSGYFCPQSFGETCLIKCTKGAICPIFCGQEQECPPGYYCPSTSVQVVCPKGHFCRGGSSLPERCSPFAVCEQQTAEPTKDFTGAVIVICITLIFFLFMAVYQARRCLCKRNPMITEVHELVKFQKRVKRKSSAWDLDASMEEDYTSSGCSSPSTNSNYSYDKNEEQAVETLLNRATSIAVPKPYSLTIEYNNINLTLKRNKQRLITNASGIIMPGKITAVMGPSGAGKSSFLAAVTGKTHAKYTMSGEIVVNGKARGLGGYSTDCAFVPQDDIMHSSLKVREVLQYQAELRLPANWPQRLKIQKVASTIRLLGLEDVMDSLIGSAGGKRGISGGQRKRVNVGMEIVSDPTFLALDEPTSGLDSTSSLRVVQALKKVATEQDLTVLVVLHQPRYEIFKQFDHLLLLAAGGKTVFSGPCEHAVPYFENLGYELGTHTNPADFVLDAVSGTLQPQRGGQLDLPESWANRPKANSTRFRHRRNLSLPFNTLRYKPRKMPGYFWQMWTCLKREVVLFRRTPKTLFLDLLMVALGGACVGGAFMAPLPLDHFAGMSMICALVLSLTTMIIALRPFSSNLEVLDREVGSGMKIFSHFIAVNLVQLPMFLIFVPTVFIACVKPMISMRASLIDLYFITAATTFATSGLAYVISTLFNPKSVQIVAVVFCLVSSQTAGNVPSIPAMNEVAMGPLLYQSSFSRWYLEAMFEKEALLMPPVEHVDVGRLASRHGYTLDNRFFRCCGVLMLFGVVSRILAFLLLVYRTRKSIKPVKFTTNSTAHHKQRRSSATPILNTVQE